MNGIDNSQDFDLFDDLVISFDVDKELSLKFFLVFAWFENNLKNLNYFDPKKKLLEY